MRLPPNICLSFRPIFYQLVLHPHLDLDPACKRLMLNCGSRSLEAATWGICWRGPLGGAGERPAAWRPRPDSWIWPCNNHNKERNDDIYIWKICNHLNKERNDIYVWKINSHHNKERNDDINIWKFCFFPSPTLKNRVFHASWIKTEKKTMIFCLCHVIMSCFPLQILSLLRFIFYLSFMWTCFFNAYLAKKHTFSF